MSRHIKEESYSADFGDFASFLYHMRQQASIRRQDLLVVDSGDLHHGTGLTDATELDGELLNPIYEKVRCRGHTTVSFSRMIMINDHR